MFEKKGLIARQQSYPIPTPNKELGDYNAFSYYSCKRKKHFVHRLSIYIPNQILVYLSYRIG